LNAGDWLRGIELDMRRPRPTLHYPSPMEMGKAKRVTIFTAIEKGELRY
jgi:hypothetical protein